jgi:hypothetical protein
MKTRRIYEQNNYIAILQLQQLLILLPTETGGRAAHQVSCAGRTVWQYMTMG